MKLSQYVILLLLPMLLSNCTTPFFNNTETIKINSKKLKTILNDKNIEFQIAGLNNEFPFKGKVRIIGISYNSTVILIGQSTNKSSLNSFKNQVKKIDGVSVIYDQVRHKPLLSISQINFDNWITVRVKSSLSNNSTLRNSKIKIFTEDREVFLFGAVSKKEAEIAIRIARNTSGVKKVIHAFKL
ncbi:25 kDa hemolysin [Candidatus Photodesmus katoptron]|uniref:BON domain-containing protein n=1 Tax=Candidatus Photodesmus anomalopis TaxID=28176 RepID=UPI0004D8EA37|nr:BON domain-containing protein [Candidatus Photodesmus katoptron]KEY90510.1 25 kDa hemolysin [Candidatus Photodesmus katoptron]